MVALRLWIQDASQRFVGRLRHVTLTGSEGIVQGTAVGTLRPVRIEYVRSFTRGVETLTLTCAGGRTRVLRKADQPVRTYELSDWLRAGGFSPNEIGPSTYRLADVRVGDVVRLQLQGGPGSCYVSGIRIMGRPGGIIPAASGELPSTRYGYRNHERQQAYQDWEEKGIPLPFNLHPGGPWPQLAPPPRAMVK